MKKLGLLFLAVMMFSATLNAQTFTLGVRYSNFSTDFTAEPFRFESGREGSFGIFGIYRADRLVVSGSYDDDSAGGIDLDFLPLDLADFTRDRFEGMIGYSVLPVLDIEGGIRVDNIGFGGIFGFDDIKVENQALGAGITLHSATIRPAGFYATRRVYAGEADLTSRD